MTWKDLWSLFPLVAAFGPGIFLFLRYQIKKVEPSQMTLIVVICWTYYLLFQSMAGRDRLESDHKVVCAMLGERLMKEDADEYMNGDSEPIECERHTPEYAADAADYEASQE